MPTGYTSKIYEGKKITKEEFIWDCARAFGALIEMRDEPIGAKVPNEFKPNTYYLNQKEKMEKELEELSALSHDEIKKQIEKEYEQQVAYNQKRVAELNALKMRYESLLTEVTEWNPPTEDHIHLKEFCIKQLQESMEFDCGSVEHYVSQEVEKPTVDEWLQEKKKQLTKEIDYYLVQWVKEQQRVEGKNKWIRELRNSLQKKQ